MQGTGGSGGEAAPVSGLGQFRGTGRGREKPLLTQQNRANYSDPMQNELDALEVKLAQVLERFQAMREENIRLRQQVVSLENANKQLLERQAEARARVESLMDRIPD